MRNRKLKRPKYLKPTNISGTFRPSIIKPIGHPINLFNMMAAPETPPGANSDGARNRFRLIAETRLPLVRKKKLRRVERGSISFVNDIIFFITVCLQLQSFYMGIVATGNYTLRSAN